ncbi:MAG: response regulator transcription factor [Gemmatimonadetes bacterium]|nr:response regulator transcription factor [Gemmatimonadota bacterium]MYD26672.1 response regulator transcription factor [Gemmatimonadota bacterium]MYJ00136.1 response regulator transcription factor [Gemmatimonadota bacterium]
MIRIVIADDHQLVRQSIVSLIEKAEDMEVVGEAADGHEALNLVQRKRPDVAMLDIAMPLLNGIETTRRIQTLSVDTRVVILSIHSEEDVVRQALRCGASGYLLKNSVVEELLIAVRSANKGEIYLSPSIAQTVLSGFLQTESTNESSTVLEQLSSREREILQLIVEGHTNQAAAEVLSISAKTVEKHRAILMKKLEVHNLPDLILVALKHRLAFLDE